MIRLGPAQFDAVARLVGDTPFTVTPFFLLQRRACDVYADSTERPRYGAILPHTSAPDLYVFGAEALDSAAQATLVDFLAQVAPACGYLVPASLVQPLRARRTIHHEVEGLCFTHLPHAGELAAWRPELVRQLGPGDADLVAGLPAEAGFLYHNFGQPAALLAEGLAFGVVREGRLLGLAASLALTPGHCDVGVYTPPRHRHLGYATDCVEAIFAHALARGVQPLWRIGIKQKVAIYFAEKLCLHEIGTDGQEVYLQTSPAC